MFLPICWFFNNARTITQIIAFLNFLKLSAVHYYTLLKKLENLIYQYTQHL